MDQKGFGTIQILIVALILTLVGSGAYYLGTKNKTFEDRLSEQNPVILPSPGAQSGKPTPETKPNLDETANWKAYTSTEYGYGIKYPVNIQPALQQSGRVYQGIGGSVNIDKWALLGKPSYGVMVISYKEGVNPKLEFNLEPAPELIISAADQQVKRLNSKDGSLTHIGPIKNKNKDLNYMIVYSGNRDKLGSNVFEGMLSTFKLIQ